MRKRVHGNFKNCTLSLLIFVFEQNEAKLDGEGGFWRGCGHKKSFNSISSKASPFKHLLQLDHLSIFSFTVNVFKIFFTI